MIRAANYDIYAERHAPFPEPDPWTFTDEVTGVPVDLTGATLTMNVRLYEGASGSALLTPTVTVSNGPRGEFTIAVSEADHEALIAAATADSQTLQSALRLRYDIKFSGVAGYPASFIGVRGFYNLQTGVTL